MVSFEVRDMSCGGCAATITRALQAADTSAHVQIDLARQRVEVRDSTLSAAALASSIAGAGYKPVQIDVAGAAVPVAPAKSSGCCCG